jgi:hypothetical protein
MFSKQLQEEFGRVIESIGERQQLAISDDALDAVLKAESLLGDLFDKSVESKDIIDYIKESQVAEVPGIVNRLEQVRQKLIERRAAGDNQAAESLKDERFKDVSNEEFLAEAQRRGFALVSREVIEKSDTLGQILAAKNIPPEKWRDVAAKIVRVVDEVRDAMREKWDDRKKYPELAGKVAPEFLRAVWGDKIFNNTVRSEHIKDPALLQAMRVYLNANKDKPNRGRAQGLTIIPAPSGSQKTTALSVS